MNRRQQLKRLTSVQLVSHRKWNTCASVTTALTNSGSSPVVLEYVRSALGLVTSSRWCAYSVGSGLVVTACRTGSELGTRRPRPLIRRLVGQRFPLGFVTNSLAGTIVFGDLAEKRELKTARMAAVRCDMGTTSLCDLEGLSMLRIVAVELVSAILVCLHK